MDFMRSVVCHNTISVLDRADTLLPSTISNLSALMFGLHDKTSLDLKRYSNKERHQAKEDTKQA